MPALPNMLWAHAFADARADFVAGDGGSQEIAATEAGAQLRYRQQRRQSDRANVKDSLAMDIIEFEALNKGAINQRRMRRRQKLRRAPHAAGFCNVEPAESCPKNPAPFQIAAIKRAAQRIQNQ